MSSKVDVTQWSETQKDYVAQMVLAVVQEVGRMLRAPMPHAPEPTGIRLSPNDEPFANRRAS